MEESDDEIAGDVVPIAVDDFAVPMQLTQLAPWHRPRKQFIRQNQWIMLSERILGGIKGSPALPQQIGGTHEVKYLTLPGSDLIDVEMLGEAARGLDCTLTSVGFLAGSIGNAATARAEMRREGLIEAGIISDRSYTLNRRIEEITARSSPAYRELASRGPYHVINLDACGSIAPPNAPDSNRIIQVVHRILEYQFSKYRGKWLLFLTSDVRAEQFDAETMQRLKTVIRNNCNQVPEFREGIANFIANDIENFEFETALEGYLAGGADNFMRIFSLGFGKWLLTLAHEEGWSVKMHNAYCYSTTPDGDDRATMPCMAFEFRPPAGNLNDPIGIAPAAVQPTNYNEDAVRVLNKVIDMENLDTRMAANANERDDMIRQTRDILSKIGYPPEIIQGIA